MSPAVKMIRLLLLFLAMSCRQEPAPANRHPSANPTKLIRVVEEAYNDGRWSILGETILRDDGSYVFTTFATTKNDNVKCGVISADLLADLRKLVIEDKRIAKLDGNVSYVVYIDSSYQNVPSSVERLREFVRRDGGARARSIR